MQSCNFGMLDMLLRFVQNPLNPSSSPPLVPHAPSYPSPCRRPPGRLAERCQRHQRGPPVRPLPPLSTLLSLSRWRRVVPAPPSSPSPPPPNGPSAQPPSPTPTYRQLSTLRLRRQLRHCLAARSIHRHRWAAAYHNHPFKVDELPLPPPPSIRDPNP